MLHFIQKNFTAITAPTNVNNISCCVLSSTQVNITWERPTQTNGMILFYEVILNNINTTVTQNTTKYVEGDTTVTTLSQLHPNHHYSCFVAAYTAAGKSISAAVHNVILHQSSIHVLSLIHRIINLL